MQSGTLFCHCQFILHFVLLCESFVGGKVIRVSFVSNQPIFFIIINKKLKMMI